MTSLSILSDLIRQHGPIDTVRVSSAQARGAAGKYAYWGSVRYELRGTRDGRVAHMACGRASSDRRSVELAYCDAHALAAREGRLVMYSRVIGALSERQAEQVLRDLSVRAMEA